MSVGKSQVCAEPHFLPSSAGNIFTLYQPCFTTQARCGALLVPPFAEEMNKSRRMFALLAHALAEAGVPSMRFDLHGTGDSAGEFREGRWSNWLADVECVARALVDRGCERIALVGLRSGALLAAQSLARLPVPVSQLVFWQPVLSGEAMLTQFLRLRMAASMMAEGQEREGTKALRDRLHAGEAVEIAGYDLHPTLYSEIKDLRLADLLGDVQAPVYWMEVVGDAERGITPMSQRVVSGWQDAGIVVRAATSVGPQFWSTVEIAEVTDLVAQTVAVLAGAGS